MRSTNELIFQFPSLTAPFQRWALTELEDAPADADVFPRVTFLGEQLGKVEGPSAHQALVAFAALLPSRRTAGWAGGLVPLGTAAILEGKEVEEGAVLSPSMRLALCVGSGATAARSLFEGLDSSDNPFPLALGLAHRPEFGERIAGYVRSHFKAHPTLGLLCGFLRGREGSRLAGELAEGACEEGRIALLRSLPGHPERGWHRIFAALTAGGEGWPMVHALGALGRLATPRAVAELVNIASKSNTDEARTQAVRSAARIGGTYAVGMAMNILQNSSPTVQAIALESLIHRGVRDAAMETAAQRGRTSEHPKLMCLSLAVLAAGGDIRAREEIFSKLDDDDALLRTYATAALGTLADTKSQQRLERVATEDRSRTVASTAIRCLVGARGGLAVRTFREALSRGGVVARAAAEVLLWRARDTPGEVFEVLAGQKEIGAGLLALGAAIAVTGAREGLGLLKQALQCGDPNTVGWALEALYPLGDAIPRRYLLESLKSPVASLRARAALALTLSGDHHGPTILRNLVRSDLARPQACRAILDLAAILPNVRGRPMFSAVTDLLASTSETSTRRRRPGSTGRPTGKTRSHSLAQSLKQIVELPDMPSQRIPTVSPEVGEDLPSLKNFQPGKKTRLSAPQGAPAAPEGPASIPAVARPPRASTEQPSGMDPSIRPEKWVGVDPDGGAAPEAPGDRAVVVPTEPMAPPGRPDATRETLASLRRSPSVILAAIAFGLLCALGLVFSTGVKDDGGSHTVTVAPVSVAALPALGFVPFAAVGTQLARGAAAPRAFGVADALMAGDILSTGPNGSVVLSSRKGSQLTLGASSSIRFVGQTTRGSETGHGLDQVVGTVVLTWKELGPALLAAPGPGGWVTLTTGQVEWLDGACTLVSGTARVTVPPAGARDLAPHESLRP